MQVKEMESPQEDGSQGDTCNMFPWSSETNWIVANGSLENSVSVESHDCPIYQYDLEDEAGRSPLVLKPPGHDSGSCEIKICFRQKYEISQVYIRSTARVYEIFYAHSPESDIEYLSTVRCGVAERNGQILQTTCVEDANKEHGEYVGELSVQGIADGSYTVPGEDDWVKIKVPVMRRNSSSDKNNIGTSQNIQVLYEATAQISEADPCSLLVIRLLSLQDKSLLYVDEVYVFVNPVELTDSGNEPPPIGTATQSSLISMLVPTLLQLSKSRVSLAQEQHASDELRKDAKLETGLVRTTEIVAGLEKHKIEQNVKPKNLDQSAAESVQIRQPTTAQNMEKCADPVDAIHGGQVERGLELLVSRVSRVEDICLKFEEKLLKPIERMEARLQSLELQLEARLQQVEHQLEKLTANYQYSGFPKCTRITAPPFSGSESNSSSFHNDGSDYPAGRVSETENESLSYNKMPELSDKTNVRPGLVVSAPEFSCGEDEDDTDDLSLSKDSSRPKPKQTFSVDDALAAALSGFMATAKFHPSEHTPTASTLFNEVDNNEHQEQGKGNNKEPKQVHQILAVRAPEFTSEEIGYEEQVDNRQSSSTADHVLETVEDICGDASSFDRNSTPSLSSAYNGSVPALTEQLNDTSDLNISSKCDNIRNSAEASGDPSPDLVEMGMSRMTPIYGEINPRGTNSIICDLGGDISSLQGHFSEDAPDVSKSYISVETHFHDNIPNVSESLSAAPLDLEFPFSKVKLASDVHAGTTVPLEALLDGETELIIQSSVDDGEDGNGNMEEMCVVVDDNEASNLLPSNHLLVDVGISAADEFSNSEVGLLPLDGGLCDQFGVSSPEVIVSLI